MSKRILIDGNFPNQYRVVVVNTQNQMEEVEYETGNISQIKGNIYLARVVRVEPGLQAAFIDYGSDKNGFLPFSEIHPDYYNIPTNQKNKSGLEAINLKAISLPDISQDELIDQQIEASPMDLEQDFDLAQIEKLIDENIQPSLEPEASENEIETLSGDKIEPLPLYKQYKIQDVIKRGQIILVQAQKEERGNKGASFSTYLSLAGKYCVLMPNRPGHHGISRRISHSEERRRLKDIISKLAKHQDNNIASMIVRTAGVGRSSLEIKRDYEYLIRLWNRIREIALKSKAPSFIHIEEGIIQKTIRDYFDSNVKEIIIQGEEAHQSAKEFMQHILPNQVNKIKLHDSLLPIFTEHEVETQISSLYQQIVQLPSGGYIVINPTEALTAIDVNSGRSTAEKNIEETALKTNLEAAKEIARQAKLRDIAGLIVVDFIDMYETRNRKIIERSLKEFMSRDRARIQIGNISSFGLLEMSRQRLRPTFLEAHTKICTHCNGKGIVRADEANAMLILRTIENEIHQLDADIINIYASQAVVMYLLNYKRLEITIVEEKYGVKLNLLIDHNATADSFSMEKITLPTFNKSRSSNNYAEAALVDASEFYNETEKPVESPKAQPQDNNNRKRKWKDASPKKADSSSTASPKAITVEESTNLDLQKEVISSDAGMEILETEDGKEEEAKAANPKRKRSQVRKRNNRGKKPKATSTDTESTSA